MRLIGSRTAAVVACMAMAGVALAGCGGSSGDSDSWSGRAVPYDIGGDFYVASWSGQPGSLTVTCSGDKSDPTMVVTAPSGDEATVKPGDGSGVKVTLKAKGGKSASYTSTEVASTGADPMDFRTTADAALRKDLRFNGQYTCDESSGS